MKRYIKTLSSALALVLLGLLIGCNITGNASDDDSTFATKTALTALQGQVAALQARVTADEAAIAAIKAALPKSILSGGVAPHASVFGRYVLAAAATTTTQAIGTISYGALSTTGEDMLSSTGYLFRMPLGQQGNVGIGAGSLYPLYFQDSTCSTTPYATTAPLTQFDVHQGVVLSPSDGASVDYVYLPKNEAETSITAASRLGGPSSSDCIPMSPGQAVDGYQLLPNDPTVTGVQNSFISNAGIQ